MNTGFFKFFFVAIFLVVITSLACRFYFVGRAIKSGRAVYEITVPSMGKDHGDTYVTDQYRIDPESKCIIFKDEFGFTKTVCGFYTVTKY